MTAANPIYLTDARGRRKAVQISYRSWLDLQRQLTEASLREKLSEALAEVADMVAGRAPKISLAASLAQLQDELTTEANG